MNADYVHIYVFLRHKAENVFYVGGASFFFPAYHHG